MANQTKMKYYHNNRCRKSREGLDFLIERHLKPEVIEYMKSGIDSKEILDILDKLKISAIELMRKKEKIFVENIKDKNLSEEDLIEWMVKEPKLIERPLLINNNDAEIGRPKENFLKII
jgi:arsenate reductase